jgi:hypothetical protein
VEEGSSSSGSCAKQSGVRRRWFLQFGGHAGRAEREMEGGSGRVCHVEEGEREKEGGCGVNSRTTGSEWLWAVQSKAAVHAHGGGGLANRGGRWGVGDTAQRG